MSDAALSVTDLDRYFILSLKWITVGEYYTWLLPNGSGYTTDIEAAGKFTQADALRECAGENSEIAIPVEVVSTLTTIRVVPRARQLTTRLQDAALRSR